MGDVPCQMTSGKGVSSSAGRGDAAATERAAEPYSSCDIEVGRILTILTVKSSINEDGMYGRVLLPELPRNVGSGRTGKPGSRLILSGSLGNWGSRNLCKPCFKSSVIFRHFFPDLRSGHFDPRASRFEDDLVSLRLPVLFIEGHRSCLSCNNGSWLSACHGMSMLFSYIPSATPDDTLHPNMFQDGFDLL